MPAKVGGELQQHHTCIQQQICLSSLPLVTTLATQKVHKGLERKEGGRKGMDAYPQKVVAGSARLMVMAKGCFKRSHTLVTT